MDGRLYIGTRRYSSWSLRGWLAVRLAGLPVETVVIPLTGGGDTQSVKQVSPSGLVPLLEHGGHRIWETLAICEYCAELSPGIWPADLAARTHARVIAAEMHAGFRDLRLSMPMNLGRNYAGLGRNPGSLADIARVQAIWAETRLRFGAGGPFLFGANFNAADAMYAPVTARFLTYQPELTQESRDYCAAVRAHPMVAEWHEEASKEPEAWRIARYETLDAGCLADGKRRE